MRADELFDYVDGNLFWKKLPLRGFSKAGQKAGSINKGYLWVVSGLMDGTKVQSVHRIIWSLHNGTIPEDMYVDHIDRNPLNNKIENLRLASPSQNSMNAKGKTNSKAQLPRNVYVDWEYKGIKKYRAQVTSKGTVLRVGNLDTIEEATLHAEELRNKLHKQFKFVKEEDL